jgi:hypothetical protein
MSVTIWTEVRELEGVSSPAPATNNQCLESVECNCYHMDILACVRARVRVWMCVRGAACMCIQFLETLHVLDILL